MKKPVLILLLALVIGGLTSTSAMADWYFGASLTDTTTEDGDFDADDNSWKAFAGWRFLKFFGIEAQYVDFGEFDDTVGGMDFAAETTSLSAFAVGSLSFSRIDLFGKAGLAYWDNDFTTGLGSDDTGTDLAYGVGAALRITGKLWIRAEWEIFEVDDADLDMASLGIHFRF